MKHRKMKKARNPIARDLLTPKYRPRVVETRREIPKRRDVKQRLAEWGRSERDGPSDLKNTFFKK